MADDPPRRKPGRPSLDPSDPSPTVHVNVRLSAKRYDAVYRQATSQRMTVPEFIRHTLTQALRDQKLTR